jgi:hypothetical protein
MGYRYLHTSSPFERKKAWGQSFVTCQQAKFHLGIVCMKFIQLTHSRIAGSALGIHRGIMFLQTCISWFVSNSLPICQKFHVLLTNFGADGLFRNFDWYSKPHMGICSNVNRLKREKDSRIMITWEEGSVLLWRFCLIILIKHAFLP